MNKEDYIKQAEEIIIKVDSQKDNSPKVKVPHWLKLTDKLQWQLHLKHYGWEKGVGWYGTTEVINIGEEAL